MGSSLSLTCSYAGRVQRRQRGVHAVNTCVTDTHTQPIMSMPSSAVLRAGQRAPLRPARPMHFRDSFKLVKRRPVVAVSPSPGLLFRVQASSSLEQNVSGMSPAPPTPASYVNHCNAEYGIDYLVDFGLLHGATSPASSIVSASPLASSTETAVVELADHSSLVNMTYDEELLLRVASQSSSHSSFPDEGLPVARLRHPQGSSADICLHGGAITSWKRPDGSEMLQLDPSNKYNGEDPIYGGLTVAWPQLGGGAMPLVNGVLQYLHWSVVETSCWDIEEDPRPSITLYADSEDVRMSTVSEEFAWPFEAMLTVTLGLAEETARGGVGGSDDEEASEGAETEGEAEAHGDDAVAKADETVEEEEEGDEGEEGGDAAPGQAPVPPVFQLTYQLSILNKHETDPLTFSAGAIANFKVDQDHANTVKVNGLAGKYVLDYSKDPMRPALEIENEHFIKPLARSSAGSNNSRLYVDCPKEGDVLFCPGSQHHFDVRNQHGFSDVLLETRGNRRNSVAVAAARKAKPVRLQPGDVWHGEATFTAFDRYWPISAFEMENDQTNIPVPAREEALFKIRRSLEENANV